MGTAGSLFIVQSVQTSNLISGLQYVTLHLDNLSILTKALCREAQSGASKAARAGFRNKKKVPSALMQLSNLGVCLPVNVLSTSCMCYGQF